MCEGRELKDGLWLVSTTLEPRKRPWITAAMPHPRPVSQLLDL